MASRNIAVAPSVRQFPQASIPRSFLEALKQGFRVISDKSKLVRRFRIGFVTLERNEVRVTVPYVATPEGYQFGDPKALA